MIEFSAESCGDLTRSLDREWLETNGIGGFASSTVPGLHTRRYHGLLTASLKPPVERYLLLSKLEETLVAGGERFELGANQFPGAVHPQGHHFLEGFRLDPFPMWTYRCGSVLLEKRLFMVHGENTTVVRYSLLEAPPQMEVRLEVRPLLAFRDYHGLTHENPGLIPAYEETPGKVRLQPYPSLPALSVAHNGDCVRTAYWYRSFEYPEERNRGLDFREDLFNPLALHFDLGGEGADILATLEDRAASEAGELETAERRRRRELDRSAPVGDPLVRALTRAADAFISRRGSGQTLIAGYPWFTDWGRDTMIALPGLTLVTGRFDTARDILQEFARHMDQGLLPNRFLDDGEELEYNTADATLWYFHAAREYARYTGDFDFLRRHLYEVLADSIDWHARGTRHGIRLDSDGLLHAGEAGLQLTWMDARVGDYVVTPRTGKPVEIQALWYNALRIMEELATRFDDRPSAKEYAELATHAARSFNKQFWNSADGYLYDVIEDTGPDAAMRPNQVLAASLPHTMLSRERSRKVVEAVRRELITPYGLRTLCPRDERYRGRYEGDPRNRDARYHQGTVWPWLIGPFVTAYVRAHGGTARARRQAGEWLEPFRTHLAEGGLGSISEILDGDEPHLPRGCIAQAWSVGEVLRALVEDVFGRRPD